MSRWTTEDLVDCLTLEREVLSKGGYGASVRDPRHPPRYLRDSVTCLNCGLEERRHPCSECLLLGYVPEEKVGEAIPCHHIPLNERGETIATLTAGGSREDVESALRAWIDGILLRETSA